MTDPVRERLRRIRHDLSNPLSAILAETQMLLLDEATLSSDAVTSLRNIEALARRMRDLLEKFDQ